MIKLTWGNTEELYENNLDLKRREGELRALRVEYSIEYEDGYKVHFELDK